ncbi:hypothetical protein ACFVTY_11380 [Streptomyces sp. NPDC058067]|uniref:hypothetical protein n=1 Tax=Streptomyces sp. NPDC058067 TaxID=3346324 RepID=UPI0036EB75D2
MPRGRHRHSPPLHRLLPPSAIAGVPLVCAAGAWLTTEPFVLRGLAGVAACVAVVGAIVMRRWDRLAGKRVAELNRSRASDEWRHDERIAELESDLDESRELRGKLETRLRAKRTELAALRNEHAALLRRYATAETERASALEGRRQLAIEASAPARALPAAAEPAPGAELVPAQRATSAGAPATPPETSPASPPQASPATPPATSPVLYLRANAALDRLARGAHPRGGDAGQGRARQETAPQDVRNERNERKEQGGTPEGKSEAARAQELQHAAARPSGVPGHFTVPAAAAVVPPAVVRRPPVEGGFDFFGTKAVAPAALEAVQNQDLADVVGEEAMALHKADAEAEFKQADADGAAEGEAVSQVIDLTAHDETEQIDVAELRSALRA